MSSEYYKILGLTPNASTSEIKKAYRRLAKRYHPDISASREDHQRFLQIKYAYEQLLFPRSSLDTTIHTPPPREEKHEDIRNKVRDKARTQREKRKQEQESLNEYLTEMGYKDLLAAAIITGKILILCSLVAFPVIALLIFNPFSIVLLLAFILLTATVIIRKNDFFKSEKFPYLQKKIYLLKNKQAKLSTPCSFASGQPAEENLSQTLYFMQIKGVTMKSRGLHDQHISYNRIHEMIVLPRSRKAFYAHTAYALINILSILFSLLFLDISSYLWRVIIGCFIGLSLSYGLLSLLHVSASSSFLITRVFLMKIAVYLSVITALTSFQHGDIIAGPFIRVTIVIILFLDPLIENLLKKPAPELLTRPLLKTSPKIKSLIKKNFQYHMDIPAWNLMYPIVKIIVG
jgi:hypothetical protein